MDLRSSPEKTSGAKLSRLIIDGGRVALQYVLDAIHPPSTLKTILNANYLTLQDLLRKRIIHQTQWDLLYPADGGPPNSSTFDITLLFVLLRNICGLHPPASGWNKKPSPADESKEADLARIKWYRNKVAHATTGVDAPTFSTYWTELSDTLVRLGLTQSEIVRLKVAPLDEENYLSLLCEWKTQDDDIKRQLATIIDAVCSPAEQEQVGDIRCWTSDAHVLGKGSKGTFVYEGELVSSGKSVAVKVMFDGVFDLREAKRLKKLKHQNIIQCFAVEKKAKFIYLALELCKKTLRACVEENDFQREDSGLDRLTCLKEITAAVAHLHERGIRHRDIKPDNILLLESNPNRFVLADFNTAKDVSSGESASTQFGPVGTVGYMAPEMCSPGAGTTEKADLFSLGCVFYYTLANKGHPFGSVEDPKSCQKSINNGQSPNLVQAAFVEHAWAKRIIENMILYDAASRRSAEVILKDLETRNEPEAIFSGRNNPTADLRHREPWEFMDATTKFGYAFNEHRQLRNVQTGWPLKIEDHPKTYQDGFYEAMAKDVYKLLEEYVHLERVPIPDNPSQHEAKGFFFMSPDALTKDKLMLLVNGSGEVKAGQWSRKMMIDEGLDSGTMLPYIERAKEKGFAVLITNGNLNHGTVDGEKVEPIRGSETPMKHFEYVWRKAVRKATAKTIVIVAHSYGGSVIVEFLKVEENADFMDRVKAVAFTNSTHHLRRASRSRKDWLKKHSRNWVSNECPLDTPLPSQADDDCECVSAGTPHHRATSHRAFESVFKFFKEKLAE